MALGGIFTELFDERYRYSALGFSYALAARLKVPLLFVGSDFSHTDVEPALGGEE